MFLFKLNLARTAAPAPAPEPEAPAEQRSAERRAVFREAQLIVEDYFKIRAVIVDLSESGVRVRYATRTDLPSRLRLCEPTLPLNCWARVVWQDDGHAGLEFLSDD